MEVPAGMQIVITLNPDASIGVAGPKEVLHNKILALGMIELAKHAINSLDKEAAERRVELAPGPLRPVPPR